MNYKHILPAIMMCCGLTAFSVAQGQPTSPSLPDSLSFFRKQIDSLDYQIISLLGQRMKVVEEVGKYKAANNIPVLQQKRFDAILQKNVTLGKAVDLSEAFITELMNAIHKESLAKEHELQESRK